MPPPLVPGKVVAKKRKAATGAPQSFDSLRLEIHERYDALSPQLQRIAGAALEDPDTFALETVVNLAALADVQPSSLVRFAKAFSYSGFSDMQRVFRVRLIEGAPAYRERILTHKNQLARADNGNTLAILHAFADASALTLDQLKETIAPEDFAAALRMLERANTIYVIGLRRAFPIAAYLAYGLTRLELRCQLLDFVGGMVPQQAATITPDDLLVAISFAEYAQPVVDVVKDVHIRGIPTLAVTDTVFSPLAKNATLSFIISDADVHRFRPVAAPMTLVQSLVIALSYAREEKAARAEAKAKKARQRSRG